MPGDAEVVKRTKYKGRQGFTLMELLVVMGIMLIVSTILVAGYFGMIRAASYTAAETDLFNHLQLARQRASLDGVRVFFMLIDSNSYVLVRGAGTLTRDMGKSETSNRYRFYDAYADYDGHKPEEINLAKTVRVWNMDKGLYGDDVRIDPTNPEDMYVPVSGARFKRPSCKFEVLLPSTVEHKEWKRGDRYGFELYPRQMLPKGFYFDLDDGKPVTLVFKPDGTTRQNTTITVFEKIGEKSKSKNKIRITVKASGEISVEDV